MKSLQVTYKITAIVVTGLLIPAVLFMGIVGWVMSGGLLEVKDLMLVMVVVLGVANGVLYGVYRLAKIGVVRNENRKLMGVVEPPEKVNGE